MKKLIIVAALLMATTSAHAGNGITIQINGERVHVEAPRNCDSLSCIRISAAGYSGSLGGLKDSFKGLGSKSDDDVASDPAPSKPAPAPVQAAAPQPAAPAATTAPASAPAPATTVATTAPADVALPPVPAPAAVAAPAPQPAPVAAAPAPTSPIGIWATEENKGNVRIEQCGTALCGYAEKSGEKILINMKPQDTKWVGRIHDPDSGRNYDSTIALKGTSTLRVQGCAFGGMFCGGQTWKRVG